MRQLETFMTRITAIVLFAFGVVSVTSGLWLPFLEPHIWTEDGELDSSAAARALFTLRALVASSGLLGILSLYAGVAMLGYLGMTRFPFLRDKRHAFIRASLAVSTLSVFLIATASRTLFLVEEGASIRPMGWSFLVFVISALNALSAIPLSIASLKKERHGCLAGFSIFFALSPFVLAMGLLIMAMRIRGFTLAH